MKNVCITGYGAIGPVHAKALENVENARLYAVCDINPDRMNLCREKYAVKAYGDFDEMLKDSEIDSVHICTPHYLHFDMIRKALEAGKSVVAEKPVTMTGSQLDKLMNTDGSEKICLVLQNRLNPCVQRFKELVESRELGEIKAVKGILTWNRAKEYYLSGEWRGKWDTEGGGVLINQAVHTLDFLTYLAGDISSIKANMYNYSLKDVIETEDTFTAYFGFKSGISGVFFATNAYSVNSPAEVEIVFEKGTARYIYGKLLINGDTAAEDKKPDAGKDYWGTGHQALLKRYYDKNEFFSLSDAENTMKTLFAMYDSAKNGGKQIDI